METEIAKRYTKEETIEKTGFDPDKEMNPNMTCWTISDGDNTYLYKDEHGEFILVFSSEDKAKKYIEHEILDIITVREVVFLKVADTALDLGLDIAINRDPESGVFWSFNVKKLFRDLMYRKFQSDN